ncbi:cytochrome P450 [Nemania sp. NC0429]|nr:cytochrome P450 [Nemania sp. NC0429]
MIAIIVCGAAGLLLLGFVADFFASLGDDPREPRRLQPRVPVVGHILGLLRHGPTYYKITSTRAGAEIYTLGVLNFKVYISASSRLLPHIQKQSKALSFRPFLQLTARQYGEAGPETYEIFGGELPDNLSQSVRNSLAPGPHLDELSLRMGRRVLVDVEALADLGRSGTRVRLLDWARHAVVQATSCAVYGTEHPFRDPEVEEAYWGWIPYLTSHLVGWLDVTGRGYALRRRVFDAHVAYCKDLPPDASHLVREHQRTLAAAGVPAADRAKQAAIFTIASFSNSAPTLYWMLWELFSRPDVLAAVRSEVEANAMVTVTPEDADHGDKGARKTGGGATFVLAVAALKTRCPLLLSVFQETQRTRHVNPSFRRVMADTLLDGRYLLREGAYLQVPGNVIHGEPDLWGGSAAVFDPYRFVPGKQRPSPAAHDDRDAAARHASGFVPWGAAPYLCPARQFAATEILIVAALLAVRFDIRPASASASGTWDKAPALSISDLATLSPPKHDIEMEISVREAWAGAWSLEMGESRSRVLLASG